MGRQKRRPGGEGGPGLTVGGREQQEPHGCERGDGDGSGRSGDKATYQRARNAALQTLAVSQKNAGFFFSFSSLKWNLFDRIIPLRNKIL